MIEEAYYKLQVMSEDEANRMIYEARLKAQRDEYSRLQGAFQKGQEKRDREIARHLKAISVPIGQISQAIGLSEPQINGL
jgi:predicted transposase/invertase (TIGR01784 family)